MEFLYKAFGWLLYLIFQFVHSYGWSIVIFTIFWKLVLLPLNIKSTKSMKETQALQPEMQKLQAKYKNNPDKLNEETMKLYKVFKVNPAGGCLPLLLQLPIIYALFGVLRNPTQYVFTNGDVSAVAQQFLWIPNLGDPDPWYILPILCVVFTFITQKFTMATQNTGGGQAESTQKMMLYTMPIIIGITAMGMPAGVALYWVVQNMFTFLQQYFMMRKPLATLDPKEVERRMAEYDAEEKQKKKDQRQNAANAREDMMNRQTGKAPKKQKTGTSVKTSPASGKTVKRKTITKIPERKE
ncbi:MAG: membrane protein insertase YidC [Eubacteriaceae bacterium]|jgi:YidC/Oxa1 family membrane protein insertase